MAEETAAETAQINTNAAEPGGAAETPPGLFDGLGDDLKGHESLKGIENLEQLVKAHVENTGKLAGLPTAPETPDAYDLSGIKVDSIGWDTDAEKSFRDASHKVGITQDQFKAVMDWAVNRSADIGKQMDAERVTAHESLKKDWGNEYETNMQKTGKVLALAFGDKAAEVVNKMGIGNLPDAAKSLLALYDRLGEHMFVKGGETSGERSIEEIMYPSMKK